MIKLLRSRIEVRVVYGSALGLLRSWATYAFSLALVCTLSVCGTAQESDLASEELQQKAQAFFRTFCFDCHGRGGVSEAGKGENFLSYSSLLRKPDESLDEMTPFVEPGDTEHSEIWVRAVKNKDMPPEDQSPTGAPPSDQERAVLEEWIQAGGGLPPAKYRVGEFISDETMLTAIRDDLRKMQEESPESIPHTRYITLTHLHNNQSLDDEQIAVARAAISKLLNSLSWRPLKVPESIDEKHTIFCIDLRDYGWTESHHWRTLVRAYPYGVTYTEDRKLQVLQTEIDRISRHRQVALRGDWLALAASRLLYDQLLELPESLAELETKLGVDFVRNFQHNQIKRAGTVQSNVSRHHRIVERHASNFGYYWRSYEGDLGSERGNFLLYPLGPNFRGHPFPDQVFDYLGGEIIFSLPNGLQAYGLYDGQDRRLKGPAPIFLVRDLKESSGTPEVVNGVSCISCHDKGMRNFQDSVREYSALFGDARRKVELLYPTQEEMDKLVAEDQKKFLRAAEEATLRLLKVGDNADRDFDEFTVEPVSALVQFYQSDLAPDTVAAELGLENAEALESIIGSNRHLKELGLGPLMQARGIKRQLWDFRDLKSLYWRVNIEFGVAPRLDD